MYNLIKRIALFIVLAAIVMFGGVLVYSKIFENNGANATSIVSVESIQKIAQLSTINYTIKTVKSIEKKNQWYVLFDTKYMVVIKGRVKGSIDLKKMSIKVDEKNRKVDIVFTEGSIVVSNPEIGKDDIALIKCSEPLIFNKIKVKDWQEAQKMAIMEIRKIAIDDGIEKKTANEAKDVLTNFIQSLGFEVDIRFEDMPKISNQQDMLPAGGFARCAKFLNLKLFNIAEV